MHRAVTPTPTPTPTATATPTPLKPETAPKSCALKDLVSKDERVLAPIKARTRQIVAETAGQQERIEDVKFDLPDYQRLSDDETTEDVPHGADSKLEALEFGGASDPAKEREEGSQASDVCFLGDKVKASMVTPLRKFIQLKRSSAEKSADREAEQGSGRRSRRPWNSETKAGVAKQDPRQGCSEKVSCSSRPSGKEEQRRKQRRKQKSSRPEKGKRGESHQKDTSTGGGCGIKGSSSDADKPRQPKGDPSQGPAKKSPGSNRSPQQRESKMRHSKVSILRSCPNASNDKRRRTLGVGMSSQRQLSSWSAKVKRKGIHTKDPPAGGGRKGKLILRRKIKSGAEIKSELSDRDLEKSIECGDKDFSSESGTKNRLGVDTVEGGFKDATPDSQVDAPRISAEVRMRLGNVVLNSLFLHADMAARPYRAPDFRDAICSIIDPKDIISLGQYQMSHVWMITCTNALAKAKLASREELTVKGKRCLVIDPETKDVKLKLMWLPSHIEDRRVVEAFQPYGKVISIEREK
ncbi:hypothetical protein HPB47_015593 [Ixodes persulcatus]|uniref:Uncharacterized protein n=1 Tax=Ixodes persulcatus TaxID=34615 RepID=A0AC60QT59_IXOPE|nr:hypothetical protein HPB47_015593 [Ixodes persulcatus]